MAEKDSLDLFFDKEEETTSSVNEIDTSSIVTEEADDSLDLFFDKEEEVVPTTTTSETTKGLDPSELFTVADDPLYARASYGEESSPGVQKPKTYDEFINCLLYTSPSPRD